MNRSNNEPIKIRQLRLDEIVTRVIVDGEDQTDKWVKNPVKLTL